MPLLPLNIIITLAKEADISTPASHNYDAVKMFDFFECVWFNYMYIIAPKGQTSSNWGTQSHSSIADSELAVVKHLQKRNI